jgi:hypothetical protein
MSWIFLLVSNFEQRNGSLRCKLALLPPPVGGHRVAERVGPIAWTKGEAITRLEFFR